MNRILKVKSILFPSLGLICILFSDRVTLLLPYLLGSAMVLVGTLMLVSYFKEKKFFEKQGSHGSSMKRISHSNYFAIMILVL